MNIIFSFACLIVYIVFVGTMYSAVKPNNNVILGVTLPLYALEDEKVKLYQKQYRKMLKIYSITAFILIIPMLFINKYFSIKFIYIMLWILGLIFILQIPYLIMNKKLMELKRENDWFVGKIHAVTIDTTVSRLKKMSAVSCLWYIIPAIISITPGMMYIKGRTKASLIDAVFSPCFVMLMFLISRGFLKMKSKVYSENTDVNLAINSQNKRLWSIFWLISAICQSLITLFVQIQVVNVNSISTTLYFFVYVVLTLFNIILLVYIFSKIRKTQNQLLSGDDKRIYADDDEYWIRGSIYCNPNDKSVMAEKRFGIGSTINIGTTAGKIINYVSYLFIAAIIIPLCALTISYDFVSPVIDISDSQTVNIKCILYNYSFNINEVEEIALVDKLPEGGIKTNGAATDTYARGDFNLNGYGRTKAYIFKNNSPYIAIKLKDIYVIYNEKDSSKTREVYNKLINLLKKSTGIRVGFTYRNAKMEI